jgi:myo-inositol-1(or 4)-monophosphatase
LIEAIQAAGEVAKGFSGPDAQRWDKADGAGPVTEADLAVNASLTESLRGARPDYGWLSEENEDDAERLTRERVFIVDPIDGTRSFVEGSNTWAISIAVAEAGQVIAAAVLLPRRDRLFAAAIGEGATLNGDRLCVTAPQTVQGASVLAARPNLDARNWPGGVPDVERHYRPSLAYRLALVGQGRFDGMLTLRDSWEWDIAAGSLIVTEAGGRICDRRGASLRFNNAHPALRGVIAATPTVQSGLLKHLGVNPC